MQGKGGNLAVWKQMDKCKYILKVFTEWSTSTVGITLVQSSSAIGVEEA